MSSSFDLSVEVSDYYDFNKESLRIIKQNTWVRNQWPLVYFIQNDSSKEAYVGESTNASLRIRNHLATPKKADTFNKIAIIGSDKFNKSATLEIEYNLIQYINAEGTYKLQNNNQGLINHNYYQQDLYKDLFKEIWNKLIAKEIVAKQLNEIVNLGLFKYSPFKALNEDQYNSVIEILEGLTSKNSNRIFVKGSAGTGKTILATYLMKLLISDAELQIDEDYNEEKLREIAFIRSFQAKYPKAKIGLVVAMSSLRETLKDVFKTTPGLKAAMVISPSDTFKFKYDLLIVDEAHRLRQYKNLSWMGAFRKNNQKLGLDDTGTELDWIIANSKNQIFFYDAGQSVKPSDIDAKNFNVLLDDETTLKLELKSQMRVKGGNNYIGFVDDLLNAQRKSKLKYFDENYELLVFDSLIDLYSELGKKEDKAGLCRLVAGFAWPWISENDDALIDIEIDGLKFQWNRTVKNWIYSPTAFNEVGCIHTVQGYDLNYTGVIFGREITYNKETDCIEVLKEFYFDKNGKRGISDPEDLKAYIISIYKTIMYRGINGTFIYAFNKELNDYLKLHVPVFGEPAPLRILKTGDIKPYVNSVPLVDISAAAGDFSDLQKHEDFQWVELPIHIIPKKGYFVCKVVGESMNKKIPNGSYCLFKQDEGGSRNGKIVLVESTHIHDLDFGSGYTVKEYHSEKATGEDEWRHQAITLKALSTNPEYKDIKLVDDELTSLKVIGIFECVIS